MKTSFYSRPHVRQLENSCDFFRALGFDCKLGRGKLTIISPPNSGEERRRKALKEELRGR